MRWRRLERLVDAAQKMSGDRLGRLAIHVRLPEVSASTATIRGQEAGLRLEERDENVVTLDHLITVVEGQLQSRVVGLVLPEEDGQALSQGLGVIQRYGEDVVLRSRCSHRL